MTNEIHVRFEQPGHEPDKSGTIDNPDDTMFPEISARIKSGEIDPEDIIHIAGGTIYFMGLTEGMTSGKPSWGMATVFTDKDGTERPIFIESSMRNFIMAAELLKARFGDEI